MNNRLATARKLLASSKTFSKKEEHKKLFKKVFWSYVMNCIICRKDDFKLTFNGQHVLSFSKRLLNWKNYYMDLVREYLLKNVIHPNYNMLSARDYELVYYGVRPPFHAKLTNAPDEIVLEAYLKENNLEIKEEFLFTVRTMYVIGAKN